MPSVFPPLVTILAGLGLFFFGLKLLGTHLKSLAGRQFKQFLARVSRRAVAGALGGVAAGFITQSGRTTSYLMAGFVQAGLMEVRRALPVVLWSNFGCTLIVFAAVLPLRELILLLVGLTGLAVAFDIPAKGKAASGALFGVALLLYGLNLVSTSAGGFTQFAWFQSALSAIRFSYFLGFLIGMLLTFFAQSHMALILITLAMTKAGFFDFGQAVMIIYGTHAGSSLITYALAGGVRGTARQIILAQVWYNVVGVAVFVTLFYADFFAGAGVMQLWAEKISAAPDRQAAAVALAFNLVTPLLLSALLGPFHQFLARRCPPSEREYLSRPQFLQEHALDEPGVALVLAEKEQLRLLDWLPGHLAAARAGGLDADVARRLAHHEAFLEIAPQIRRFLADLLRQPLNPRATDHLLSLQSRQEHLETLETTAWDMLQLLRNQHLHPDDPVLALGLRLLEGFDTQLLTLSSVLTEADADELTLLRAMTADHGDAMQNLRRNIFAGGEHLTPADRPRVLQFTNLFERAAWAIHRYAELLEAGDASAREDNTR